MYQERQLNADVRGGYIPGYCFVKRKEVPPAAKTGFNISPAFIVSITELCETIRKRLNGFTDRGINGADRLFIFFFGNSDQQVELSGSLVDRTDRDPCPGQCLQNPDIRI